VSLDANLPKKARLDLLTQLTLQKLVEGYETKAIVDAVLEEIEHATDRAFLAELKISWEPETMRQARVPAHALIRTSDGKLWHLPVENIEAARKIDPQRQVLRDPRVN
jgi:hypothetical protein